MGNRFPRTSILALLLAAAIGPAGCKKDDPAQTTAPPGNTNVGITVQGQPGPAQTHEESGVTRYSDEGPEIGTVLTQRPTTVHKAADQSTDVLSRLGPGTAVNKKARHGPYFLVDYPTGTPGELKPGWVLQNDVTGNSLPTVHTPPPAITTGQPPIKINVRK